MQELNYKFTLKADYLIFPKNDLPRKERSILTNIFLLFTVYIIGLIVIIYLFMRFLLKKILPSKIFEKFKRNDRFSMEDRIKEFKENFKETEIAVNFNENSYIFDKHEFKYQVVEKVLETETMYYLLHKKKRFKRKQEFVLIPKENINENDFIKFIEKKQEKFHFKIERYSPKDTLQ